MTPRPAAATAIKVFHTLAWLSIESCVVNVLYAGFAGRTGKRVGMAAAVVAGESLVFAGNGFFCPLTALAKRYGAESGSVTDIYLPDWFAHNIPAIHTPLLALMAYLHREATDVRKRAEGQAVCHAASPSSPDRRCLAHLAPRALVEPSSPGHPRDRLPSWVTNCTAPCLKPSSSFR